MTKNKQLTLIALLVVLFFGCKKDFDKYDRPDWLAGKLYTQILTRPELSTFAELLKISGYDTIIDVSGSSTVFAPSNDAFKEYFQNNLKYKSVSEMSKAEVIKLVKYHLVQNSWSKKQLTQLDVWGWIDTLDLKNNMPKGYKRETLLLGKNQKYGVVWSKYKRLNSTIYRTNIIDTTSTSWYRRVFTDSRKYAPIFYKEYFDIYNLSTSDYTFYYNRPFLSASDLYYAGSRIASDEIFAENGFVYVIDKVVEPLKNGVELLTDKSKANYSTYYNLVNLFSEFTFNQKATFAQPGADQGLKVDSLFDLRYPQLIFDINSEKTRAPRGVTGLPVNVTIRYHQGIVAPTNEAMNLLVSQYLAGGNNWGSLEAAPENIKRIVANSSLSINSVYQTDLRVGFLNGEADIIPVDETSIVQKEYGSNCTFIGVNKPIVPRAFSSVTGPVYLRKGFSKVMFAIEKSGLLSALKRKDANYSFFVEADVNSSIDSSFIYDANLGNFSAITLYPAVRTTRLSNEDLRILLLNHVGLSQPDPGGAKKQFIKNLAGNYLIYDNVTKEVKGTAPSTYGFQGAKQITVIPQKISTNSDNGSTYEISNWLNFSANNLFIAISSAYPKFHSLLKKAGYSLDNQSRYSFMSENQYYTVLVPTTEALVAANADAMSINQLQSFLLLHFIQGELIFTDGSSKSDFYETARIDGSSTPFTTVYTRLKVVTGIDKITIPLKDGSPAVVINESPKTNILTARNLSTTGTEAYTNSVNNGVIHEVDKALMFGEVDTK